MSSEALSRRTALEVDEPGDNLSAVQPGPSTPDAPLEASLLEGEAGEPKTQKETRMSVMDADDEEVDEGELGHRKLVPDTPLLLAAFHVFKGNVGMGIFLLPMIYNDTGYILSPLVAIPVGIIVTDSMVMLLQSKVKIARSKVNTFPDVGEFVFGSICRIAVNTAVVLVQLSFCLMYIQGAATIFSEIFEFDGAYKVFAAVELFIVLPLCFLSHNLKLLAISSTIATFCVWFTVAGTTWYFITALNNNGGAAPTTNATGSPAKWPLFIASNLTVLEGIAIILPVENAVARAQRPKVPFMVRSTMSSIIVLYALYAMTGYLAYGCAIKNTSVTVLPYTTIGKIIRAALAFNVLLTHPLQFVPAIQILDKAMGVPVGKGGSKSKRAIFSRVGINILIVVLAILLGGDALALVVSFAGATAAVFLAVILPGLLGLHTDYAVAHADTPREGGAYYKAMFCLSPNPLARVKCFAYVIFGIAVFFIGTVACVIDASSMIHRSTHRGNAAVANGTSCDF
jgi:proton-coupled amino acid transporter